MRTEHVFVGPQVGFHVGKFRIDSGRRIQQYDSVVSGGFVDFIERQCSSGCRALCLQRFRIDHQPASRDAGHERGLQCLGRHVGRALQERWVRFMRRCSRILKRGHARLLTHKGYLARDSIK